MNAMRGLPDGDDVGAEEGQDHGDLLTTDEREAVGQAGRLYTFIAERIVAHGPTRDDDLAELRAAVHVIQRTVEAQAAARAYPREFRLLGTVIPPYPEQGRIRQSHTGVAQHASPEAAPGDTEGERLA
jgi:hypothetical protein